MDEQMFYDTLFRRIRAARGRFVVYIDDGNMEPINGYAFRDPAKLFEFRGRIARFWMQREREARGGK